jgi:hypothetical protein
VLPLCRRRSQRAAPLEDVHPAVGRTLTVLNGCVFGCRDQIRGEVQPAGRRRERRGASVPVTVDSVVISAGQEGSYENRS